MYFSVEDGLAEARTVFLAGCGLPAAWAGRGDFTIAELGFGTGLNLLALWQLWRAHRPSSGARLHMVSFEGYPMAVEDAARALSRWPELAPLAGALLSRWPVRARGVQRLDWPQDGLSLTLHIDDISRALPNAEFCADAWFLDGFSPARNPDMWSEATLAAVAARTRPGGRAASFTVAGAVRRGLEAAGFRVTRAPGHGRKRERLEAVLPGTPPPAPATPQRVAILGAGLAGAALAEAFTRRGAAVTVFDPAGAPASGASGNPLGLVHPRLDAADNPQARLQLLAFLHAHALYTRFPHAALSLPLTQIAKDETEARRFARLDADPPLDAGWLTIDAERLTHRRALVVRPARLVGALLDGADLRLGAPVALDPATRCVNGEVFDHVVLASAMAAACDGLPLIARGGQVESLPNPVAPFALARSNYAVADGERLVFGANFGGLEAGLAASPQARAENLAAFARLCPELAAGLATQELSSRASVRATTPDRLPVAGALVRPGGAGVFEGVSVLAGLGSRGFTLGPLMAEAIAATAFAEPSPLGRAEAEAVSPARFILRARRRTGHS